MVHTINGKKSLSVAEAEHLQKQIQRLLEKKGLKVHVSFHPNFLKVPTAEED